MTTRTQTLINSLTPDTLPQFCDAYAQYNCIHKRYIWITDKYTHERRRVLVPCGRCKVCKDQRISDWVSRMLIHTTYCAKHCYFITLTYKTYSRYSKIPKPLLNAYWRKDNYNSTGHMAYSPCLLRHEHFQRFMKYLRKNTGDTSIKFFMCGEHGEKYSRPHFHAILWSINPIKQEDIYKSWSVNNSTDRKSPDMRYIGHVDICDLNLNGVISSASHKGRNAFRYVAKYCCKQYDAHNMPKRIKLFMQDLCNDVISEDTLNIIFDEHFRSLKNIISGYADFIAPLCRNYEYKDLQSAQFEITDYKLNITLHEQLQDKTNAPFLRVIEDYLSPEQIRTSLLHYYKALDAKMLSNLFGSYCRASNRSALGYEYAICNADKLAKNEFRLPQCCGERPSLPRYFKKLGETFAQRFFYTCPSSSSRSLSYRPLADSLPIDDVLDKANILLNNIRLSVPVYSPLYDAEFVEFVGESLRRKSGIIVDKLKGTKGLICRDSDDKLYVSFFKYNSKTRNYDYAYNYPLADFVRVSLEYNAAIRHLHDDILALSSQSHADYDYITNYLESINPDYGELLIESEDYNQYISNKIREDYQLQHNYSMIE